MTSISRMIAPQSRALGNAQVVPPPTCDDPNLSAEKVVPLVVGKMKNCRVIDLHPHPSYTQHQICVSSAELGALAKLGELAYWQPVPIASTGSILFGYAQYELARLRRRTTLECIEYDLSDDQALEWLLRFHRQGYGLNDFVRILLALDLETFLQKKGRVNQSLGGRLKGLSNLTTAERLDVRSALAASAGTCAANIDKVKHIRTHAGEKLISALRNGEISIHHAWKLSKLSHFDQLNELQLAHSKKGIRKTIHLALSNHLKTPSITIGVSQLIRSLSAQSPQTLDGVAIIPLKVSGRVLFVTDELCEILNLDQKELAP